MRIYLIYDILGKEIINDGLKMTDLIRVSFFQKSILTSCVYIETVTIPVDSREVTELDTRTTNF
jgi:hypothetical protein